MPFWSITAKWSCGALAPRATIHAVETFKTRSLCGVDVRPYCHRFALLEGEEGDGIVSEWPPPIEDRCPDCAAVTKVGGRQRRGSYSWTAL